MRTDLLHIIGYWSEERQANGFRIRGPNDQNGERYKALYAWLHGGRCSAFCVMEDFPWDFIAFTDPWDEQNFLTLYQNDISFDDEEAYRPLPKIKHRQGVLPIEQRVEGQSYLENCGHHHIWRNPTSSLESDLVKIMATAIADEIDAQILEELWSLGAQQRYNAK